MFTHSKDGVTVASVLDNRRAKNSGVYPVKIRVTFRRDRKYYATGKNLTEAEWVKLPDARSKEATKVKKSIQNSFEKICTAVDDLVFSGQFSFERLNARIKTGLSGSISDFFKNRVKQLEQEDRIGNAWYYNTVLRGLERAGISNKNVDEITVEWLTKYEKFLLSEGKSVTTVGMHLRAIRAILNEAKRHGKIADHQYPFGKGRYEIQEGAGRKMALTLEQIGKIARYDNGSLAMAKYRDYWLFLYLCNGMNMADFVKLKYSNIVDGEIYYIRQKTERTTKTQREIRVTITDPIRAIIDRCGNPPTPGNFIFPILDGSEDATRLKRKTLYATKAINKAMKSIGEATGIGNVSTYTARHSFATVLKRSGANIAYISESLGHSDMKTTENYLDSFEKEERQKNAELLTKF